MRLVFVCLLLAMVAHSVPAQFTSNVTGAGNVGIGQMSGGTINIGISASQLEAALKAEGAERQKLLREIAKLMNMAARRNATAASGSDEFSVAVVQRFLATVVGRKVPKSEWPQIFGDLAARFAEAGVRIASTPANSGVTRDLLRATLIKSEAGTTPALSYP